MKYHAPNKLGKTQSLTEDGFLLCQDVPIARTGDMFYAPGEIPVAPGASGIITITRSEDEVFTEKSLASLNGAPLTLGHPPDNHVHPKNFKEVAVGTVLNPRRGTGDQSQMIIADVLIKDAFAIDAVRSKAIREVSAGYACDYIDAGDGRGTQHGIRHNHLALVQQGRCGSECTIGDHSMTDQPTAEKTLMDKFMAWVSSGGSTAPAAVATGDEAAKIDKLSATVDKLSEAVAKLLTRDEAAKTDKYGEDPDDDSAECNARRKAKQEKMDAKTGDAIDPAALGVRLATVRSRAEILSPGIKFATIDAASAPTAVVDHICSCQRQALTVAMADPKSRDAVTIFAGDAPDFSKMSADAIELAFMGASEVIRARNNAAVTGAVTTSRTEDETGFTAGSIAAKNEAFNRVAAEGWAKIGLPA